MTTAFRAPPASSDQVMWDKVQALYTYVEGQLAQALQRQHGIGLSEYRALAALSQSKDDELRMQELADRIGMGQSSVTRLVGRLDVAGYAHKDLCPDDKRGVYAVITEGGRERYTSARVTYAEILSSALNTAGADPQLAGAVQALRNSA